MLPLISVSGLPRLSLWDPSDALFSALNRHAENGDVQTSVSVLLVLGEQRAAQIDEAKQEQWFLGYIELLNRHQLWNTATQVTYFYKTKMPRCTKVMFFKYCNLRRLLLF